MITNEKPRLKYTGVLGLLTGRYWTCRGAGKFCQGPTMLAAYIGWSRAVAEAKDPETYTHGGKP